MQLFDSHFATMKAVIIEINVNRFLVKKISETISSHLKTNNFSQQSFFPELDNFPIPILVCICYRVFSYLQLYSDLPNSEIPKP